MEVLIFGFIVGGFVGVVWMIVAWVQMLNRGVRDAHARDATIAAARAQYAQSVAQSAAHPGVQPSVPPVVQPQHGQPFAPPPAGHLIPPRLAGYPQPAPAAPTTYTASTANTAPAAYTAPGQLPQVDLTPLKPSNAAERRMWQKHYGLGGSVFDHSVDEEIARRRLADGLSQ